jgi:hypothetical protein
VRRLRRDRWSFSDFKAISAQMNEILTIKEAIALAIIIRALANPSQLVELWTRRRTYQKQTGGAVWVLWAKIANTMRVP